VASRQCLPGPHGLQKTREAGFVSNHGDFEPTFNDILIGFQDRRSNPYSWTMDNGDSSMDWARSDQTLFVASPGELCASMLCLDTWSYNAKLTSCCGGSLQGHTDLMLSVIYTTGRFACQKYMAKITEGTGEVIMDCA
jgi:hypothetical protein